MFFLEAVHLGRLTSAQVWLNGGSSSESSGWYLDWIKVEYHDIHRFKISKPIFFACGQWVKSVGMAGALHLTPVTSDLGFALDSKGEHHLVYSNKLIDLVSGKNTLQLVKTK